MERERERFCMESLKTDGRILGARKLTNCVEDGGFPFLSMSALFERVDVHSFKNLKWGDTWL